MSPVKESAEVKKITVPQVQLRTIDVPIVGTSPLMTNPWTQKARQGMEEGQGIGVAPGSAKKKKEPKNPDAEYEARLAEYRLPSGANGFPAVGFKASMVRAASQVSGITMTDAKVLFRVSGVDDRELVTIDGEPKMDERAAPNSGVGAKADLRFRPIFYDWGTVVRLTFDAELIDDASVLALLVRAGEFVGIGEYRPSAKRALAGDYGLWEVADS